jgi:hypothetical protein
MKVARDEPDRWLVLFFRLASRAFGYSTAYAKVTPGSWREREEEVGEKR